MYLKAKNHKLKDFEKSWICLKTMILVLLNHADSLDIYRIKYLTGFMKKIL